MGYEIFTCKRSRITTPGISINPHGRIGLNRATSLIFEKIAVQFVLLLWDQDRRHLAIRPIVKKDSRAFGVSFAKSSAMFTAKTFFEHIGFKTAETQSFPATWNEAENMLEVEIPAQYLKSEKDAGQAEQKPLELAPARRFRRSAAE